jgi:hypothetical protein
MLMKYKNFKRMSKESLKEIMGGNVPIGGGGWCSATATCANGTKVTLVCEHAPNGCVGIDYTSSTSGNGYAYCQENGVLTINQCSSVSN